MQSKIARIIWFLVVCLGFTTAGILISKSYLEWQTHPIATSITTHPIPSLDFPIVTICPPRDTKAALYHDLVKAGKANLTKEKKQTLKSTAYDTFAVQSHMEFVRKMNATLNMGNTEQVMKGFHSLPRPYKHVNGFEIHMWNLNGTITTPWFEEDYVEEYYKEDKEFHFVLELPEDIKEQVGSGSLHIELEFNTREQKSWVEKMFFAEVQTEKFATFQDKFYFKQTSKKNWTDAEADCQVVHSCNTFLCCLDGEISDDPYRNPDMNNKDHRSG